MIEDSTLVARAKTGDYAAFDELVNRHERRLYTLARGIVRNAEDAEDVVQTAFLSALENLSGFREEASFGTWVSRIAIHAALKVLRRRGGLETVPLQEEPGDDEDPPVRPEYVADWSGDPAAIIQQRELRRFLNEAVESLPEKYRVVFVLRDMSGLSVAETADVLHLTQTNVKVRLLRARLALREKLTQLFAAGEPPVNHEPDP